MPPKDMLCERELSGTSHRTGAVMRGNVCVLEKEHPGTQAGSILLPDQLLPRDVMLGKSLNLVELCSLHLQNEGEEDEFSDPCQ